MSIGRSFDSDSKVLSKIGEKLYLNAEKADVYFIFPSSGERVPAHKIFLSSGSDVYQAMFYGLCKEEGDIIIVDVLAEAFKEFLRFFYFTKIDVSLENMSEVMYLGIKYNVPECFRSCVSILETNIKAQNVISTLNMAILYEQKELQKSCESFMTSNAEDVLKSDDFALCDRQVLEHILKMDDLSCFAKKLFEACMSWVKAASKEEHLTRDIIQCHMGNLFYDLQFGCMSLDEFFNILPKYGKLFDGNEYNDILQVISGKETETKVFQTCRRYFPSHLLRWDNNRIILCDRLNDNSSGYHCSTRREEVSTFSTNTKLLLGYFHISRIFAMNKNFIGLNTTIVANSAETLTQFTFDLPSPNGLNIYLPKPIIIKPGNIYQIRIAFPMDKLTLGNLLSTVKMERGIVVQFQNDEILNGEYEGAISALGFNLLEDVTVVRIDLN